MKVFLESITPQAEKKIVEIARVSSTRDDKSAEPEKLIKYLIDNKHWSPFEHAFLTFEIITSKAIGIQLLRHRSFTFQEFSQRYAKVENFEPIELRQQAAKNRQSSTEVFDPQIRIDPTEEWEVTTRKASEVIENHLRHTQFLYDELLRVGVAKECARMILPMRTQTTIYMTGSIRSWIHFLSIRDDRHAQKEAQEIAREIKRNFIWQLPIISKALNYE